MTCVASALAGKVFFLSFLWDTYENSGILSLWRLEFLLKWQGVLVTVLAQEVFYIDKL
jgi:hypothetical protein